MPWSRFADGNVFTVGSGSNPAYQNSWVSYDSTLFYGARYYRDSDGYIYLEGLVKSGTIADGTTGTIFTLPVNFRPNVRILFPVVSNGAIGRCDIYTDGSVVATNGNNAWFSLGGISFKAA